ncbi:hypothetical protein K7432_011282 [Basidiobolus ranarum]|uniref:Uncharacterized protein n=1 Tax=Basidiobolus ranarum TaxID=34480 RepID=A0ABR2WMM7_9FUNG
MKATGYAHVCFFSGIPECSRQETDVLSNSWFHGHFIPQISASTPKVYGLIGREAAEPPKIHHCCFSSDLPSIFYDVTVLDYETNEEEVLKNVFRPLGVGDAMELTTEYEDVIFETKPTSSISQGGLSFRTTKLKVGEDAQEHLKKYFPNLLLDKSIDEGWIVCLGEMSIWDFTLLSECKELDI